ncbi:MAG: hypothetical protein KBS45_00045 [Clostridiales bacterium]|nr:hypothetical protein [Candidatus Coliplasma caballi]
MQNVLERRELVSGFPSAAVEGLLGRSTKAAHSDAVSGWLQTGVSGWLQTGVGAEKIFFDLIMLFTQVLF